MNDKDKRIKKLEKENKELKRKLKAEKTRNDPAWDFHWNGHGDYEEARRCFYGDFD